jgi:hypothetical protein
MPEHDKGQTMARKDNEPADWMALGWNSWMLGMESAWVIQMRLMKIAGGGAAGKAEATRMVSEKVAAHIDLAGKMVTGRMGTGGTKTAEAIVKHYAGPVKANARRLSKK